ncbi:hypothetical protein THRCLA_05298, partial [Thraustotheca clavata]
MRKEIREQVALLHAKIETIARSQNDRDNQFELFIEKQNEAIRLIETNKLYGEKMIEKFAKEFDGKLETLELRIVNNNNLQALNEDLIRLKLNDKEAWVQEQEHQHNHVISLIEAESQRVGILSQQQNQLESKIKDMATLLGMHQKQNETRIEQTLELANTLTAGQGFLEETYQLETKKTTARLQKLQHRLTEDSTKLHKGYGSLLVEIEVLQRELNQLREIQQKSNDEIKDLVISVRVQGTSNTSALRTLAEEVLRVKRHRTEDYRRATFDELTHGRRKTTQDDDEDVVSVLNKALLQSNYASFVPSYN